MRVSLVALAIILVFVAAFVFACKSGGQDDAGEAGEATPAMAEGETPEVVAVSCMKDAKFYHDQELKNLNYALFAGDRLKVVEALPDRVQVISPSGQTGWVQRVALCTPGEYERRKKSGLIPASLLIVGHDQGGFHLTGALQIRNNQPYIPEGGFIWMDPTTEGKEFEIYGEKIKCDPNVIYVIKNGKPVKLPAWGEE